MKAPVPQLPPGLTVEDMTGGNGEIRRMNLSLYRRGKLTPEQRARILKRLKERRGDDTGGG